MTKFRNVDGITAPTKSIEHNSAATKRTPIKKTNFLYIFIPVILLAIVLVAAWRLIDTNQATIPQTVVQYAGFPIYYPTKLPTGYTFQKGSARIENNIVIYKIQNSGSVVTFNEQSMPSKPPNLNTLTTPQQVPGPSGISPPTMPALFHTTYSPAGQAIIGTGPAGNPVAIIVTRKTVINIVASDNSPGSELLKIVQHIALVK